MFKLFESGYDPGHPADQAITATRNAVFPCTGCRGDQQPR